jgi:hypothetical protein
VDVATSLQQIWRRKRWLVPATIAAMLAALVVSYHVSVWPPGLASRSLRYGTANTGLLVDSARSSLATVQSPLTALSERAQVYGQLLQAEPVRRKIGELAGVPWQTVSVDGFSSTEPSAAERSSQLVTDGKSRQVFFRVEPNQPIIHITSNGPTGAEAASLAEAAANALPAYIEDLQARHDIAGGDRVVLEQIGQPDAGVVSESAGRLLAVTAALAVFGLSCLAILFVPRLADLRMSVEGDHRREESEGVGRGEAASADHANGAGEFGSEQALGRRSDAPVELTGHAARTIRPEGDADT